MTTFERSAVGAVGRRASSSSCASRGRVFWTFGFPLLITVALGIAFRNQGAAGEPRRHRRRGRRAAVAAAALGRRPAWPSRSMTPRARPRAGCGPARCVLALEAPAAGGRSSIASIRAAPTRWPRGGWSTIACSGRRGGAIRCATRDETAVARGARYVDWLVPGLLGMQLLNGAMWGAAFNIVNARQRKLLKRLAATPMRRGHYLLSFRVSGLLFVPLQVLVLFGFARLAFGVTIHGSVVATLALALLGSWSFAGLGLLCASRAQNSETANGLINLVTLPMMVFSGVFFSSSRFPRSCSR